MQHRRRNPVIRRDEMTRCHGDRRGIATAGCLRLNIAAKAGPRSRGHAPLARGSEQSRVGGVMTRRQFVSGVLIFGMLAAPGAAGASPRRAEECADCAVTFSVDVTPAAARVTASGARGVVLDKRMDREGLAITISAIGDTLHILAAVDGTVTITRLGRVVKVRPGSVLADYQTRVRDLIAGSAAVDGIERMVHAVRNSGRAQASSVFASFALLRALQGDDTGNTLLAERLPQPRHNRIVRVAAQTRAGSTVNDCWDEYERTLERNSSRYRQCLVDYWWAQPVQYACGLEFAMVAELALFRLISCSGGFPI